jgi:two-component system nitrogen regulation response regulator GlnG
VLAATNKNLAQLVARHGFREDLYYRLNVINLHVPALRCRREEIPRLTARFLEYYAAQYGRAARRLSDASLERFMTYPWPGNVRELENIITRIVVLGAEEWVAAELAEREQNLAASRTAGLRAAEAPGASPDSPLDAIEGRLNGAAVEPEGLKAVVDRAAKVAERAELDRALGRTHWRRVEAARQLKISYRTLLRKIEEHGLNGRH